MNPWHDLNPTTDDAEHAEAILALAGDLQAPWAWRFIGVPVEELDHPVALLIAVALGGAWT